MLKLSVSLILLGLLLILFGGFLHLALLLVGAILLATSIFLLWRHSAGAVWVCKTCAQEQQLNWKQTLFGRSIGFFEKELDCPHCGCKTVWTKKI